MLRYIIKISWQVATLLCKNDTVPHLLWSFHGMVFGTIRCFGKSWVTISGCYKWTRTACKKMCIVTSLKHLKHESKIKHYILYYSFEVNCHILPITQHSGIKNPYAEYQAQVNRMKVKVKLYHGILQEFW